MIDSRGVFPSTAYEVIVTSVTFFEVLSKSSSVVTMPLSAGRHTAIVRAIACEEDSKLREVAHVAQPCEQTWQPTMKL